MDLTTIVGMVLALGAILGGNIMEGGHTDSLMQLTAAIIVMGGTIGAVVVQFPGDKLKLALKQIKQVFSPVKLNPTEVIQTIVTLANKARREGLIAIEKDAASVADPFMRRALELAVDGTDSRELRSALEMELGQFEAEGEIGVKFMEAAGGYSPTIGIIGAVLGLIHVMQNLSDPSKLGAGIAVAFVATVYGVATANLFYLPMSGKLKMRLHEQVVIKELVIEGICDIADSKNPRLIERKLGAFLHEKKEVA